MASRLRLQLPGGASLEVANGTQATLAASVVRALAKPLCVACGATRPIAVGRVYGTY